MLFTKLVLFTETGWRVTLRIPFHFQLRVQRGLLQFHGSVNDATTSPSRSACISIVLSTTIILLGVLADEIQLGPTIYKGVLGDDSRVCCTFRDDPQVFHVNVLGQLSRVQLLYCLQIGCLCHQKVLVFHCGSLADISLALIGVIIGFRLGLGMGFGFGLGSLLIRFVQLIYFFVQTFLPMYQFALLVQIVDNFVVITGQTVKVAFDFDGGRRFRLLILRTAILLGTNTGFGGLGAPIHGKSRYLGPQKLTLTRWRLSFVHLWVSSSHFSRLENHTLLFLHLLSMMFLWPIILML